MAAALVALHREGSGEEPARLKALQNRQRQADTLYARLGLVRQGGNLSMVANATGSCKLKLEHGHALQVSANDSNA